MTHDPREAHFTNEQLDTMYEASKRDAHFVGSEIRQLIGDIRTAREALTASAPKGEPCADWSDLPKDIYVIGAQRVDAVGFDIQCCSVPMVTAPEVRYVRADMISSPPPAAGWDNNQIQLIIERALLDDEDFGDRAHDQDVLEDKAKCSAALIVKALRREAPAPSGVKIIDPINSVGVKGARKQAAETHASMISRPDAGGDVREALEKARKAIASLSRGSLGYAEFEDWDPPFSTHRYSIRDDLLREIDAALSTPSDAVNASAEARLREALGLAADALKQVLKVHGDCPFIDLVLARIVALSAGGDEAKKSGGEPGSNCSDLSRSNCEPERSPSEPPDRREIVARPHPARVDYRKFMEWAGLSGPRPTNAELAFYLEIELGNREEVDAVEAAVLREAIAVLAALDGGQS